MSEYIIACSKAWCAEPSFIDRFEALDICLITSREELTIENVTRLSPRYIFFPHWNWIVPAEIYQAFECVVFHVAPLPYGRGGSPIQNLIARKHKSAPLNALRMTNVVDGGPVYCSEEVSLGGTIDEIFARIAISTERMIRQIIEINPTPEPQDGDPVVFKRRTPDQSALAISGNLESLYDQIRMVDGGDYPRAFIQHGAFRIEFSDAQFDGDTLKAVVSVRTEPEIEEKAE